MTFFLSLSTPLRHHRQTCLWIFGFLSFFSLFAEIIANERPLLIQYDQKYYFPIFKFYSETTFGGVFETEAKYHEAWVKELIDEKGWMLMPPVPFSPDTIDQEVCDAPTPPSRRHLIGTDDLGRDVLSRLIYGYRLSVFFGILVTFFSAVIGLIIGGVQGYFGGKVDLLLQRLIELWASFPLFFCLIILASILQPNFFLLMGIMVCFKWLSFVAYVRADFLRARQFDYVRAARALGVGDCKIMYRHILPNAMVTTLTHFPFAVNSTIAMMTSLDFLGFGFPVGTASFGDLLHQGKVNLHAPWLGITACVAISLVLLFLVFIGENIQEAFDPHRHK